MSNIVEEAEFFPAGLSSGLSSALAFFMDQCYLIKKL